MTNRDDVLWAISRTTAARGYYSLTMATKYYTHFVTARAKAQTAAAAAAANANEWSGVVELRHPLEHVGGTKELRALLAQSFDLDSDDIKILHWARLH
ncbi:MAG TPA: hypothetical protein VNO35_17415 [Steroidobacteraceae bacterium]|nr:hypothetical protein [Steroidobacteraceae bacterium]